MVMSRSVYPAGDGHLGGFPTLAVIGGKILHIPARARLGQRVGGFCSALRAVVLIYAPSGPSLLSGILTLLVVGVQ